MAPPLLLLSAIDAFIGGTRLLDQATLSAGRGERICVVGRNGSGKSTLLRIAAGEIAPAAGTRFLQPGATLRYLAQEPDLSAYPSIGAFVAAGLGPGDDPDRVRRLLEDFGLDPDRTPHGLSGGESRRAALAQVLAPDPDILLLDEPTNHLDLPAIGMLEEALLKTRSALVVISHDRRFLQTLSRRVVWIDRGQTRVLEQGFANFEAWRDEVLAAEETAAHKLARQVAREEDWLRYGVTARRKRNVRRLAGLHALRAQKRERVRPQGQVTLSAELAQSGGTLVVAAEAISKSYGERTLVRDFSSRILRGERIGIIGPNGAGKTTLLKLLTGKLAPDSGQLTLGTGIEAVTLEQMRDSLDPQKTLAETLTQGSGDYVQLPQERRHVIGYMKDFLFRPEQARTPVGVLSGGERGRLLLAVALARPSNLMVLDEPTNDLDLDTLDLLQEMLADYAGTVLLVSHDRDFLDRVVTSTIAAEGDGQWIEYAGGYSDMIAQRGMAPARDPGTRKPRAANAAPAASPSPARKMSFKDKHALQTLPAEIERLSARIAAAETKLQDPDLFRRDPKTFDATMAALQADTAARTAAEERWLQLEMLREDLEG